MLNCRHELSSTDDNFLTAPSSALESLLKHLPAAEIPSSTDLLSRAALEEQIADLHEPPPSVIAVGDIMLGGRAKKAVAELTRD